MRGCGGDTDTKRSRHQEPDHQNKIQNDVDNTGACEEYQRTGRVSRRSDHSGAVVVKQVCRHSAEEGAHIKCSLRQNRFFDTHEDKKVFGKYQTERGYENACDQSGKHRRMYRLFDVGIIFCTDVMRNTNSCADRKSHKKTCDERYERSA